MAGSRSVARRRPRSSQPEQEYLGRGHERLLLVIGRPGDVPHGRDTDGPE